MPSSEPRAITVIGAGVIGLTTALRLSNDANNKILVVAEFMPGDYDIGYASPWAGANFFPMGEPGSLQAELEQDTWKVLKDLASILPAACIHFQDAVLYTREEDVGSAGPLFVGPGEEPWWGDLVDNYAAIRPQDLPPGIAGGSKFRTVCINTALYLPYLVSECRRMGVVFLRRRIDSITDVQKIRHADGSVAHTIVNATGLGSLTLKGVEDTTMYPARGQTALVQNDPGYMMAVSGGKSGNGLGYCMTRAAGGGTVVGGCYQINNFESAPDANLALRFLKNVVDFCPEITKPGEGVKGLKIVRHGVGLRPVRRGGPRIEKEVVDGGSGKLPLTVVHCYGHGGFGYQTSWASADLVAKLIREAATPAHPKLRSML